MDTKIAYPEEMLDGKLQLLRYLKKLYIVLIGAAGLSLILGGIYLLSVTVFAPAKQYEATAQYYVEYALQEDGTPYTYINDTTWNTLVGTDLFMEDLTNRLPGYTREDLTQAIHASLLSDVRYLVITYTSDSPEKAMEIYEAFEGTLQNYVDNQREIDGITRIDTPGEATLVLHENRILRVMLFGLIVGAVFTGIFLYIYIAADDRIYLPVTFEKRYGIPMLWTASKEEMPALTRKLLGDKKQVLILSLSEKMDSPEETISRIVKENLLTEVSYAEVLEKPELLETAEGIIFLIRAGIDHGKALENVLMTCEKLGKPVTAGLLIGEDAKLLRRYYGKR